MEEGEACKMSKMHFYGVDNQSSRVNIIYWIALLTAITTLCLQPLVNLFKSTILSFLPGQVLVLL